MIFEAALQALEMSYCLLLEQGDYNLVPPGHIHGFLSAATPSAICGPVLIAHSDQRSAAEKVMEWESKLLDHRKTGTSAECGTVKNTDNGLQEDKELWDRLDKVT